MKIVALTVENFLRIEAAEIRPDGNTVVISGPNEAGKSALLNAMWVAIGGDAPEMPIREGADKARIVVEVGDDDTAPIIVERVWTASGAMRLKATQEINGSKVLFSKPQTMLSAFMSGIAFDPEAFARMEGRKQAELLSRLTGLDTSDLDAEHKRVFDERLDVGRRGKAVGAPVLPEGPEPQTVDAAALVEDLRSGDARNRSLDAEIVRREEFRRAIDESRRGNQIKIGRLETLRQQVADLERVIAESAERIVESESAVAEWPDLPDRFDPTETQVAIASAESCNAAVREYEAARRRMDEASTLRKQYQVLTDRLSTIKTQRAERVAACKMPLDGMSIDDGVVKLDNIPISQASRARKLEIGFAIGRAQHPKLKVVRIENGSLLDAKMMAVVERECEEHGYQGWIERVADADSGCGFYIEDGRLAERGDAS